jgi:RNase adapter protein RapZ
VARYQSTRRSHPLCGGRVGLLEGIRTERALLAGLRDRADVVMDTTGLNVHELTRRVQETMLAGEQRGQLLLTFVSFGYKFGLPLEADMVLDARFLPNPHWVEELRPLTGQDEAVKEYVLARPETHGFLERAAALLQYLVPLYTAEQKTQLLVAIGCTGGRHRSVALAEALTALFAKEAGVTTSVRHRDLDRRA